MGRRGRVKGGVKGGYWWRRQDVALWRCGPSDAHWQTSYVNAPIDFIQFTTSGRFQILINRYLFICPESIQNFVYKRSLLRSCTL